MVGKTKMKIKAEDFGAYFVGEGSLSISIASLLYHSRAQPSILIGEDVSGLNGGPIGTIKEVVTDGHSNVTALILEN